VATISHCGAGLSNGPAIGPRRSPSPTVNRHASSNQTNTMRPAFDDLRRDLAHGARVLRRNPGFAAVVLTTLALASALTVTVFSIVDAWLFRPLNFPQADRLVIAFGANPERPSEPAVWMPYRV
jgi:hypothetical protein